MLQGTFETLALPELLGLLASARKTGALRLEAGPISGVVHLDDGHCRAVETADHLGRVSDGAELLARLVDVCFAVTRQESGAFRFASDEPAPWLSDEPVELSDALVEVDRLLKQWREILRVIPSLDCRPRLLEVLEVDEIVLDRERWALLVAIDGRRTVRELVQRAARPVIDVCHTLLELIEAGAIGVVDPDPVPAGPAPAAVATPPRPPAPRRPGRPCSRPCSTPPAPAAPRRHPAAAARAPPAPSQRPRTGTRRTGARRAEARAATRPAVAPTAERRPTRVPSCGCSPVCAKAEPNRRPPGPQPLTQRVIFSFSRAARGVDDLPIGSRGGLLCPTAHRWVPC